MSRKPTSLADVASRKAAQSAAPVPTPAATKATAGAVRNVMVRLSPEAFDQLHDLFYEQRRPKQQLLAEARNDLFVKYGKPPIASAA